MTIDLPYGHEFKGLNSSHPKHIHICLQLENNILGSLDKHITHLSGLNDLVTLGGSKSCVNISSSTRNG